MKHLMHAVLGMATASIFAEETGTGKSNGGGQAKAPRFAEKDWDDAFDGKGGKLTIRFANGEAVEFDAEKVEDELTRHRLMMHGASQKIGDSYASVKGDFAAGLANAQEVVNLLYNGEWSGEREGGGPRLAELAEAIARIKGVPVEKARAAVDAATKEDRDQWRTNNQVKLAVAEIRAERAKANLEKAGTSGDLQINLPA